MAEIATGVLHNVGNVLNSVNVSATLIAERLTQSKTDNLAKAAGLLEEQNGSLASFLPNDPKGQLLPELSRRGRSHLERSGVRHSRKSSCSRGISSISRTSWPCSRTTRASPA